MRAIYDFHTLHMPKTRWVSWYQEACYLYIDVFVGRIVSCILKTALTDADVGDFFWTHLRAVIDLSKDCFRDYKLHQGNFVVCEA